MKVRKFTKKNLKMAIIPFQILFFPRQKHEKSYLLISNDEMEIYEVSIRLQIVIAIMQK